LRLENSKYAAKAAKLPFGRGDMPFKQGFRLSVYKKLEITDISMEKYPFFEVP